MLIKIGVRPSHLASILAEFCFCRASEQFKEAINDEDFEDLLKDAQADPKAWRRRTCSRRCCRSSTFRVGSYFDSVPKLLLTGKRAFTFVVFRLIVGRR